MANNLSIENARLIFRNFAGREGQYNDPGVRNFCVVLPEERAERLKEDGWNIRIRAPREDGEEALYYLPVAVRFDPFPPKIYIISSLNGHKTRYTEDQVKDLDDSDLYNIDLIIRPRYYKKGDGTTAIKAYLKTMYATLEVDEFAYKYTDEALQNEEDDEPLPFV